MKLNAHGLKLVGLKKASGNTRNYGAYSGSYDEVFYDRSSGEVWTVFHHSLGGNSWSVYNNPDIIKICTTSRHMTMQQLADAIFAVLSVSKKEA